MWFNSIIYFLNGSVICLKDGSLRGIDGLICVSIVLFWPVWIVIGLPIAGIVLIGDWLDSADHPEKLRGFAENVFCWPVKTVRRLGQLLLKRRTKVTEE